MIKRLKMTYALYNFFHKNQLSHNLPLYKKYGINKSYYSSISSADFAHMDSQKILEASRPNTLETIQYYDTLDEKSKSSIRDFDVQGYCIIRNFWNRDQVEKVNNEIDTLLKDRKIKFKYGNKLMFAIHKSNYLKNICNNPDLKPLLDYLIMGNASLFQSINFLTGSQQKTHSDSIHMTTFPAGGLLGVWIALEKITADNGPVHYYPKSHLLPYYMNKDYDNEGNKFLLGDKGYQAYEKMIQEKVIENKISKQVFTAEPGDMFIWHANMLHGGEPVLKKGSTRKSMVLHYFDSNRVCYHEITQRPALINQAN